MVADAEDIEVRATFEFDCRLRGLSDSEARRRITYRIRRMSHGHFGDVRSLGGGLFELRIDYGPGYRIYCPRFAIASVLVLAAGDKRRQDSDIRRARSLWRSWDGKKGS